MGKPHLSKSYNSKKSNNFLAKFLQEEQKYMPLEYFIEELTPYGKVIHSSTFNAAEAGETAIRISRRTKNPITVTAHIVPFNQIENAGETVDDPINALELFEEICGKDAKFDEQNAETWLFLQLLSETANEVLADYKTGILTVDHNHKEDEM